MLAEFEKLPSGNYHYRRNTLEAIIWQAEPTMWTWFIYDLQARRFTKGGKSPTFNEACEAALAAIPQERSPTNDSKNGHRPIA